MSKKNRIRIYVDADLYTGGIVVCSEAQAHYLLNVMRLQTGNDVYVFNGRDGEFKSVIAQCGKKQCALRVETLFKTFENSPDVWLLFAPLKKDQTDFVIAKAVELGVSEIIPVITEYTSTTKMRTDRLHTLAIEAAEQSRRQDVPLLREAAELNKILNGWPAERTLFYLDESGNSGSAAEIMPQFSAPAALLVGPEGGFSEKELEFLKNLPYTYGISLGKRILRAETAVVAGLSCWQALCGDWRYK